MKNHSKILLFLILFFRTAYPLSPFPEIPEAQASSKIPAEVLRVIDGDTLEIRLPGGQRERLRCAGIDTPELHHPRHPAEEFALLAKRRCEELLAPFEEVLVELEYPSRDAYGRLLGYLWLPCEGSPRMMQEILLAEGLGVPRYLSSKALYAPRLQRAFEEGQRANRGFWRVAPGRRFTPAQIRGHLPYLRGRFVLLECLPGSLSSSEKEMRMATEEPRVALVCAPLEVSPEVRHFFEHPPQERCFVIGKISVAWKGAVLSIHHACQILRDLRRF